MKKIVINEPDRKELYDMHINKHMTIEEISNFCNTERVYIEILLSRYHLNNIKKGYCLYLFNKKKEFEYLVFEDKKVQDKIREEKEKKIKKEEIKRKVEEAADKERQQLMDAALVTFNLNEQIRTSKKRVKSDKCKNVKKHIKTCYRCDKKKKGCLHHIIPKYFGGRNDKDNLVYLCDECHDYVEIKTYELLTKSMIYDNKILRLYIVSDFPEV